jgi:YggT family protein
MNIRELLCRAVDLYILLMFVRIVLSFFPMAPSGGLAKVSMLLRSITDPLLDPLRRILPPLGGFDLSPLVLMLTLRILVQGLILRC